MVVSLWLLGLAWRPAPRGTACAIWTGVGTIGTALLGMALFSEPAHTIRLACIGLIIAGNVGLKLVRHILGTDGPGSHNVVVPDRPQSATATVLGMFLLANLPYERR